MKETVFTISNPHFLTPGQLALAIRNLHQFSAKIQPFVRDDPKINLVIHWDVQFIRENDNVDAHVRIGVATKYIPTELFKIKDAFSLQHLSMSHTIVDEAEMTSLERVPVEPLAEMISKWR